MDFFTKRKNENDHQYIWRLCYAKDNGEIEITWPELADILNRNLKNEDEYLSESAYRKKYQQAKLFYDEVFTKAENESRSSEELQNSYPAETSMKENGTCTSSKLIEMSDTQAKDPDYILKAHGFDPRSWRISSVRNTMRQVCSKNEGLVTLYASFLTAKPCSDLTLQHIDDFYNNLAATYKAPFVQKTHTQKDGYLLEVPIMDVHFGKLSLSEDVAEPYNYMLAKERFNFIIDDVINHASNLPIEKIVFPVGSDFFHVDTLNATTTAGTPQNTDLSPQLIFEYGLQCLIDGITKLSSIAPVEVFCVNGNHDFLTSYHAISALWCYFNNNKNVYVRKDTSPRKYMEFGKCLIGFAHGDKEKKRIDGIMQIEARESWGRTLYREFHLGHLHSEHAREANGIIFRNLSSVTGTDSWHHNNGYIGSIKKSQSFLWDKRSGLKNILITTIA